MHGPVIRGIEDAGGTSVAGVVSELAERYERPLIYVHVLDGADEGLVVGDQGPRSSLPGSVSAEVSRRAGCPVIIVPPTGKPVETDVVADGPAVEGGIVRFGLGRAARRVP